MTDFRPQSNHDANKSRLKHRTSDIYIRLYFSLDNLLRRPSAYEEKKYIIIHIDLRTDM